MITCCGKLEACVANLLVGRYGSSRPLPYAVADPSAGCGRRKGAEAQHYNPLRLGDRRPGIKSGISYLDSIYRCGWVGKLSLKQAEGSGAEGCGTEIKT
jgi:hypothetical protein